MEIMCYVFYVLNVLPGECIWSDYRLPYVNIQIERVLSDVQEIFTVINCEERKQQQQMASPVIFAYTKSTRFQHGRNNTQHLWSWVDYFFTTVETAKLLNRTGHLIMSQCVKKKWTDRHTDRVTDAKVMPKRQIILLWLVKITSR